MTGPSHLRDSAIFGHLWATSEMRDWFAEPAQLHEWLRIYAAIAAAQADLGTIPRTAADRLAEVAGQPVDLPAVAARTRETGHSTAGLIEWLREVSGPAAAPYAGVATAVQDISDTWTALTLQRAGDLLDRDLRAIAARLRAVARQHRRTAMLARTHGQPAVPITAGFKAAQWGAEVERHLHRLGQGRLRWESAPIGGSVGSLAYWGEDAPRMLGAFANRVGLSAPVLPWGSSRDRVAEFASWATLVSATLAKIGNEVYQLQRPELGELGEPATAAQIGSVTMPHKRNPERSEHLVTLNTLVRASAEIVIAGAVTEHERDGRVWKAEWVALPDLCCALTRASSLARELLDGVEIHVERMRDNIETRGRDALSEQRVRSLASRIGYPDAYRATRAASSAPDAAGGDPGRRAGLAADAALEAAVAGAVAFTDRWLGDPGDQPAPGPVQLGIWPTPLQKAGTDPGVLVKREDLCGFAFGGSKVRALEPLLGAALAHGARTLVVGGRRDSNWVALAALAAARLDLACHCVFDPGQSTTLAMALATSAGARLHTAPAPGAAAVNATIAALAGDLGPAAVGVARAGAEPAGVRGYRTLLREILVQAGPGAPVDIVTALGSGGLAAGLLLALEDDGVRGDVIVHAVPVAKTTEQARQAIGNLLDATQPDRARTRAAMARVRILPRTDRDEGYAQRVASSCGVLLDPVFSGPAWRAYGGQAREPGRVTVLLASGGLPALLDSMAGPRPAEAGEGTSFG